MSGRLEPGDCGRNSSVHLERALAALIEQHEVTNWRDIPTVSTAEAAMWTQRLQDALDAVEGQR